MPKRSAALLPFRYRNDTAEVLLVHPGGPFWAGKDDGSWSLAKGEYEADEDPLAAARREFTEETGFVAAGEFLSLGEVRQKSGKFVTAWAFDGDFDASLARSNSFSMEWPPRSGRMQDFPEVDRAEWFAMEIARERLLEGQRPFLDALAALLFP
jgi:predicted NUDIX family NTP pyrophosphohydrolase